MKNKEKEDWWEYSEVISSDMFEQRFSIVFTDNPKLSLRYQRKANNLPNIEEYKWGKSSQAAVISVTEKHYAAFWVVFDWKVFMPHLAVHEAVHMAYKMLAPRGIWLNESSEETYAYAIEFLFNKIMQVYERAKTNKEKNDVSDKAIWEAAISNVSETITDTEDKKIAAKEAWEVHLENRKDPNYGIKIKTPGELKLEGIKLKQDVMGTFSDMEASLWKDTWPPDNIASLSDGQRAWAWKEYLETNNSISITPQDDKGTLSDSKRGEVTEFS